jgi:hypothetical protein
MRVSAPFRPITRLVAILAAALLVGGAGSSLAANTTPPGLNPGDQYRLIFVTSTTTDATSSNISDYDNFVSGVANGVAELQALGTSWSAVGSTLAVDARDHTNTNNLTDTGVPIYLLNGQLLASNNADLWNGNVAAPLQVDEMANIVSGMVWTGTIWDGKAYPAYHLGSAYNASFGLTDEVGTGWVSSFVANPSGSGHLYAISGTLTMIPEPGTATLLMLGLVGMTAIRRNA